VSERDHGWPDGYGWTEYLDWQVGDAASDRLGHILYEQIVTLQDEDEKKKALNAWLDTKIPKGLRDDLEAECLLAELEGRTPRDVFSAPEVQHLLRENAPTSVSRAGEGLPCP